jgi:Ca2+-binding EF-hand superfamily protein
MMRKNYVTIDIERERMKAAFSLLDIDGDGFLSRQELMDELVAKLSGILRVRLFSPQIKPTASITEILLRVAITTFSK